MVRSGIYTRYSDRPIFSSRSWYSRGTSGLLSTIPKSRHSDGVHIIGVARTRMRSEAARRRAYGQIS
jgi:hypothetical protein